MIKGFFFFFLLGGIPGSDSCVKFSIIITRCTGRNMEEKAPKMVYKNETGQDNMILEDTLP
jgi:hypothetical protein